ncbi:trehalose-phosphatase, partial [Patescibacteria group bacterium]|nr:trehalose-phosphatase [Patescibacteria group bacterium]
MKDFKKCEKNVFAEIKRAGKVTLMLDFDGVLSEIVPVPSAAVIAPQNRRALRRLARVSPIAIISGRMLKDVMAKVKVSGRGLIFSGTHGLEWEIGGKRDNVAVPRQMRRGITLAKTKIRPIFARYPGAFLEDKKVSIVCHYRRLGAPAAARFENEARAILSPIARAHGLRLDHDNKSFELRPDFWDKGDIVRHVVKYVRRNFGGKFLPIYIGDALTDEDAFRALPRGVTVRVGRAARR